MQVHLSSACLLSVSFLSVCVRCAGNKVANHLIRLKPTLESWVPHVLSFIVPRQVLPLGDPTRRSCDACEAFGAWLKKTIKQKTCRRKVIALTVDHVKKDGETITSQWKQTFKCGYIQQAFSRAVVREKLGHGTENEPYLQRADWKRLRTGKTMVKYDRKPAPDQSDDTPARPRNLKDILAEQGMGA